MLTIESIQNWSHNNTNYFTGLLPIQGDHVRARLTYPFFLLIVTSFAAEAKQFNHFAPSNSPGTNHSHATKDLYDSIAAGNYPEWKLFIQTIDPDYEDRFDFDPLDVTKTWPEDIIPLQPVGRMVLNKNIDNFFAENEQLAFCPSIVVPGVYYSDDKLLQTRIFSYSDTQRHRLGPNYLMLPPNAPKCAHHNNHHEGFMNFMHRDEEVNC